MEEEDHRARTQRMKSELRKKYLEHEKASRANNSKNTFDPPWLRRSIALPLFGIAIVLYSYSFYSYRRRASRRLQEPRLEPLQSAQDIAAHDSRELFGNKFADDELDDAELLTDNKTW